MQRDSSPVAIVFPGQGSQYAGMGREIYEYSDSAKECFHTADRSLGKKLSSLCFEGSMEELMLTENAQPAILTHSIALYNEFSSLLEFSPKIYSGHSLGEYSALVASGALGFEDAVRLVRNRGRYMQSAVPVGTGSMAAIIGIDIETVRAAMEKSRNGDVLEVANYNAPDQIVIAGNGKAVERCMENARTMGAKRCISLKVSAPFHCSLMLPAAARLSDDLDRVEFGKMAVPVVANVNAQKVFNGEAFRRLLLEQVSKPVLWVECVRTIIKDGVRLFIEIGPGKVLAGLIKRIDKNVSVVNIEKPDDFNPALQIIREG